MRTPRLRRAVALAALLSATAAVPAAAHQGNPNFRSVIRTVQPRVPGLQVRVLGFDDHFELTNHTGRTVVVYGYAKEPYARVLPDGTVQQNVRSPAVYLNEDRYGEGTVPASAKPSLPPAWRTLDKTARFTWHDHRMHWMSRTLPPKVQQDQSKRVKIFDYQVPLSVGGERGQIAGTLLWVGSPSSFPVAAVVSLVAIALLAIALVVVVRRRRGDDGADDDRDGGSSSPTREAW